VKCSAAGNLRIFLWPDGLVSEKMDQLHKSLICTSASVKFVMLEHLLLFHT